RRHCMTNATLSSLAPAADLQRLHQWRDRLLSLLLLIALLALAEVLVDRGQISRLVLAAPSHVWAVLEDGIATGFYVPHVVSTVSSIFAGFLIAATIAITVAGLLASIPMLERVL